MTDPDMNAPIIDLLNMKKPPCGHSRFEALTCWRQENKLASTGFWQAKKITMVRVSQCLDCGKILSEVK